MKFTNWILAKLDTYRPADGPGQPQTLNHLGEGLFALRKGTGCVFGLDATKVEAEGRAHVDAGLVDALLAWRKRLEAEADVDHLLALAQYSGPLGMPALRYEKPPVKRVPLRCDPLGTRDGLSREWRLRLERLDALVAGRRTVMGCAASGLVESSSESLDEEDEPDEPAVFSAPYTDPLFEYALDHETATGEAYPRELAALHATVGTISLAGGEYQPPFLALYTQWTWDDEEGVHIGAGEYGQGSLWLKPAPGEGPLEAKVVNIDDDGVVGTVYPHLGALLDLIMER